MILKLIGLYSIYYAKKFDAKVFFFFLKNLELFARNISLNALQENITLISNPLTDKFLISNFFKEILKLEQQKLVLIIKDL